MFIREIVVMDANATKKSKAWVTTCIEQNVCLCGCGEKETPTKPFKRGLCSKCYYDWRTTRAALGTDRKRAAYDASLIRMGKLLAPQSVRNLKSQSVFSKAAAEVG